MIVTWCHRTLEENERLKDNELKLLKQIQNLYYLGDWVSIDTYKKLFGINNSLLKINNIRGYWIGRY